MRVVIHVQDASLLPNFGRDYNAFVKSLGVKVSFLTEAHTHPYRFNYPSGDDVQGLYDLGGSGAKGIIISGKGKFSLYSIAGRVPDQEGAMGLAFTFMASPENLISISMRNRCNLRAQVGIPHGSVS